MGNTTVNTLCLFSRNSFFRSFFCLFVSFVFPFNCRILYSFGRARGDRGGARRRSTGRTKPRSSRRSSWCGAESQIYGHMTRSKTVGTETHRFCLSLSLPHARHRWLRQVLPTAENCVPKFIARGSRRGIDVAGKVKWSGDGESQASSAFFPAFNSSLESRLDYQLADHRQSLITLRCRKMHSVMQFQLVIDRIVLCWRRQRGITKEKEDIQAFPAYS